MRAYPHLGLNPDRSQCVQVSILVSAQRKHSLWETDVNIFIIRRGKNE